MLAAMTAAAIPLSTSLPITLNDPGGYGGTNPGSASSNGDVLGLLKDFDIDYIKFTVITAQEVQALIHVNYDHGAASPLNLYDWPWNGKYLRSGDLLFDVNGTYKYAVPIAPHDSLTAGALYMITNVKDSDTVLGTSSGIRPDIPVWMDKTGASLIGSKIALSYALDAGISGIITLRFDPNDAFLADLANPGLSVHYASATCANDYMDAEFRYVVPEPVSMVLMGGGLVGLGLIGRRRLRRRA
jgi:hypothetical protein